MIIILVPKDHLAPWLLVNKSFSIEFHGGDIRLCYALLLGSETLFNDEGSARMHIPLRHVDVETSHAIAGLSRILSLCPAA